jgi:hypothetical protein
VTIPTLSTLAWFAGMAPAEIPEWFSFTDPHPVPRLLSTNEALDVTPEWHDVSNGMRSEIFTWLDGGEWDLEDPVAERIGLAARELMDKRRDEIQRTRDANEAARFYAWRWAYARQMVKGLAASEQNAEFDGVLP